MKKTFTVYKTTNLSNNKYYIGVHGTMNPNDDYFGSGTIIQAVLKRHGAANLKKEILFSFETEKEAYSKELEILKPIIGVDALCMNLIHGGKIPPSSKGKKRSPEFCEKLRKRMLGNSLGKFAKGIKKPPLSEKHRRSVGDAAKIRLKGIRPSPQCLEASKHRDFSFMQTQEYKKKMAESVSHAKTGKKRKPFSEEWKANLGKAGLGRRHSPESKAKMSLARSKHWENSRKNAS